MVDMFYSLQNYTTYSMLSGIKEPKEWVKRAKELGYTHLGICDKETLGGVIEFQKDCVSAGIKPIIGVEFSVYNTTDREKRKNAVKHGIVLLYAKNETGFLNLIAINNFAQDPERGFYYRPRIDYDILESHSEGVLCVVPSVEGVGTRLQEGRLQPSELARLVKLDEIFKEDLYVGINPMLPSDSSHHLANATFASLEGFNFVYTFNSHYPCLEQKNLYSVVRTLDSGNIKKNADREVLNGYLPSEVDVQMMLKKGHLEGGFHRSCVNGLKEVADKCDFLIKLGAYQMPQLLLETGSLEGDIIKYIGIGFRDKLCPTAAYSVLRSFEELDEYGSLPPHEHVAKGENPATLRPLSEYVERVKYEFEVIKTMGFLDYFHIVRDICAKNPDRGPARGSAAGSLLSYLLDITKVDPIRHDLLFERFLNPSRKDLPDIDIDFSTRSVVEVEKYIEDRYGKNRVFPIITHARLKIASGVKDVARAYNYTIPDNTGKIVSYDNWGLDRQVEVPYVRQTARGREELEERLQYDSFVKFYERHSNWFESVIMPLQEAIVNDGIHAAGTVIAFDDPDKCLPIQYNGINKKFVTQWKDRHCEERGFPKFDLLTIKTLDVINDAKALIKERHGVDVPSIEQVPLNDSKALSIFKQIKTDGIFQFNTFSQKQYFEILKPNSFEDLVAAVALVRPGPMMAGTHTDYADVKNGRKEVHYDHPDLEPILKNTYGHLIYQESMMQIVQKIGGLTAAESEYVRKACGKKNIVEMKKWESTFKERAFETGRYEQDFLDTLWKKIEDFAEYSFNKSHALSYTLISYYQAYIKSRWPMEFWSAVLRHSPNDAKKENSAFAVKHSAEQEGIEFVYPSVEYFAPDFEPVGDKIAWPLSRIKGMGVTTVKEMCKEGRRSFISIQQMLSDLDTRIVNKRSFDAMICVGFFDPLCKPWEAAEIYHSLRNEKIPYELDHRNLFRWYKGKNEAYNMIVEPWKKIAPFHQKVQWYSGTKLSKVDDGQPVFIGGYIDELRIKQTKNGKWFASANIIDSGESVRVYFWSDYWENEDLDRLRIRPAVGQLIEVIGIKKSFNDVPQVSVDKANNYVRIVWDEEKFKE
jgi:DNA polymerase-3 subunit alpha